MREREVLQISLGSPACQVTAHLLNLQGLAATSDNDDGTAYCQAGVTHGVTQQLRVPRALLVAVPRETYRRHDEATRNASATSSSGAVTTTTTTTWSGRVEPFSLDALGGDAVSLPPPRPVDPWLQTWRDTSHRLATSQFSRYRVDESTTTSTTTTPTYTESATNSRHVDWDNLGDEEGEEQEESPMERHARLERQRRQWHGGMLQPLQAQLDQGWQAFLGETELGEENEQGETGAPMRPNDLLWTDYLAPPYHPRSILALPAFQEEDAYFPVASGKMLSTWMEAEVLERVRNMLEECDACQGCILSTSGFGIFAGLGTQVLHYLQDECPSNSRVVLAYNEQPPQTSNAASTQESTLQEAENWRSHYVETTRSHVNKAMAWYDLLESSNAVLPLRLPTSAEGYPSRFHATAAVAAALEATTLPFRARPNDRLRIGMNSYYRGSFSGDSDFGSVSNLSLSEFLSLVKPRDKLSVLELDSLSRGSTGPLWPSLLEGTSIERDHRMREAPHLAGSRRPQDVEPGRWMLSPDAGGRMTSFSMLDATDRALHTHFALASAIRPAENATVPLSHYVDCLMQGMGIRFRPEQSAATVLDQSLASVTLGGYGAGSYWKSIGKNHPILSLVGNTTRFYPQAHNIALNLKAALSPRFRGFCNRDVAAGSLPESEDCQEALSLMWDLRDLYQPPDGSGLVVEDNEAFLGW